MDWFASYDEVTADGTQFVAILIFKMVVNSNMVSYNN